MKNIAIILMIFFCSSRAYAQTLDWKITKSAHFIVYHKNAPEEFIQQIIERSEDYYDRIAEALGFLRFNFWLWDDRAKIYVYDNKSEYQNATGQPAWSYGSAVMGERVKTIQCFPYEEGFFETVLPHEMGHIIFKEFVGLKNPAVPYWLDEGVASYQEKSGVETANIVIQKAKRKNKFINLKNLFDFNPYISPDSESVNIFYAEAVSLVDFLIKEFGRDNFVLFCQNLRDKKDFQRAMASTYSFGNIQELEQSWQEYLKNE